MPFPYTIEVAHRVAMIRKVGRVDAARVAKTVEAVFNDRAWQPGFDTLWDDSETTELLLERQDLMSFVALQRRFADRSGPGRDVMASTRAVDRVMGQMYSVLAKNEHRTLILCTSMAEARGVLGLPDLPAPPSS